MENECLDTVLKGQPEWLKDKAQREESQKAHTTGEFVITKNGGHVALALWPWSSRQWHQLLSFDKFYIRPSESTFLFLVPCFMLDGLHKVIFVVYDVSWLIFKGWWCVH